MKLNLIFKISKLGLNILGYDVNIKEKVNIARDKYKVNKKKKDPNNL